MQKIIAALFVDKKGIYSNLSNIITWGIADDARSYPGEHPVIAHPPCQLWGKFAKINYKRWGGEHNKPGNDGGCFESALKSVRRWGGVLEHPAQSYAWAHYGLKKPTQLGWNCVGDGEWVCGVYQSAYGHPCRKKTWLFFKGKVNPIELIWDRPDGFFQIGFHDQRGKSKNKPTISGKKASATPLLFRDALIKLVSNCC